MAAATNSRRSARTVSKEEAAVRTGTRAGDRPRNEGKFMTAVTHEMDGKVGVVTLAKPPHNLLDDKLIEDLVAAYQAVIGSGCRAILLRSSMRHFCAGAEMASWGTGTTIHTDQPRFEAMLKVLEDAPVPTVAAVNGGAL